MARPLSHSVAGSLFVGSGVKSRHTDVDIVVVRENTEGEYSGLEHEVVPGVTESLKVMTRDGTLRIAEYAFEYAYLNFRKKVTAVHKVRARRTRAACRAPRRPQRCAGQHHEEGRRTVSGVVPRGGQALPQH